MDDNSTDATAAGTEAGSEQPGPIERLNRVRDRLDGDERVARFEHERHDGTRKVTEKYADGTTKTYTVDAHE